MEDRNMVKINIAAYFPAVTMMLGENNFDWQAIDNLFNQKLEKRRQQLAQENAETIIIDASIYDIIVEVKKRNLQAIRLLDFFNRMLADLSSKLSGEEKKLVANTIWNVLTALDHRYLDFIGEVAVLNGAMQSGNYRLLDIEYELSNGKTIDFELLDVQENKTILVEVYNIHLKEGKVEEEKERIEKFLTGRLERKINKKKHKLQDHVEFDLVPVLWGSAKDLKVYADHFKQYPIPVAGTHEPVAFASFIDTHDEQKFEGRFMRVSRLFDASRPVVF